MNINSQKVSSSLALNKLIIEPVVAEELKVKSGKNVIFAVDVSGSMYGELSKIRKQLKNRIPNIINENDTISIIWFSGRSQAGILKEGVKVKNLLDLQALNDAIDRFLVPIGLTAFLPPLELTEKLVENLSSNGNDFSFIFLSDGYNNDSVWPSVIAQLGKLESKIAASTFIEYGYYADSNALTEMAEIMGGEKIFAKDFDTYEQDFEKIITKKTSEKRVIDITEVKSKLKFQYFYTVNKEEQSMNVYSCKGKNEVLIPEDVTELFFFTENKPKESLETSFDTDSILTAAFLLADRLQYKHVEDILINLGDVALINQFAGAYGKQKLNQLKDRIKELAFDPTTLYSEGKKEGYKINPKQYCVMDLINDLQDGDNLFFPYHDDFNYNRTGAKKTTKAELTEEMQVALSKAKSLKEIEAITNSIEIPEFIYPENAAEIGMNFNGLTWNSERANLSVLTRLEGKVKLPSNEFGLTEVDSFIFRNYTFIKDGILNITEIPVKLEEKTYNILATKGLISSYSEGHYDKDFLYLLDLSTLPVINRSMATNASAKKLADLEFELINIQLGQKYLKNLKDTHDPKTNKESAEKYSPEAAAWLKSIGVTDYNGFTPKTETEKTGDFYIAPTLKVKIEKTSTSPKVTDVLKKVKDLAEEPKAKPLNVMESIMSTEISKLDPQLFTDKNISIPMLNDLNNEYNKKRKDLLFEISKIKFGVILSRGWFSEFVTMAECELEGYKFKNLITPLTVKFDYTEQPIDL